MLPSKSPGTRRSEPWHSSPALPVTRQAGIQPEGTPLKAALSAPTGVLGGHHRGDRGVVPHPLATQELHPHYFLTGTKRRGSCRKPVREPQSSFVSHPLTRGSSQAPSSRPVGMRSPARRSKGRCCPGTQHRWVSSAFSVAKTPDSKAVRPRPCGILGGAKLERGTDLRSRAGGGGRDSKGAWQCWTRSCALVWTSHSKLCCVQRKHCLSAQNIDSKRERKR